MLDNLEFLTQLANISGIPKTFGLNVESLLTLIFGSVIIGYICLTFYYKIYNDNERWTGLNYSEKAIISLVIGFLSIFASLYFLLIYQLIYIRLGIVSDEYLKQFFLELMYVSPFLYFIGFSALTSKSDFVGLDFIKKYMNLSFNFIIILNFALIFTILSLVRNWGGLAETFLLFFIYLAIPYSKTVISTFIDKIKKSIHWKNKE